MEGLPGAAGWMMAMLAARSLSGVVVDLRVFPFFADPERVARARYGVSALEAVARLEDIGRRGLERLRNAVRRLHIPGPDESLDREVLGFYAAAVLAYLTGNRWLVSRLALAEAERGYSELQRMEDNVVAEVGRLAGIKSLVFDQRRAYMEAIAVVNMTPVYRVYPYSVGFLDYVRYGRRLLGDDAWKPAALPVRAGRVYLDKHRAARLVKEALTLYVEERIRVLGSEAAERGAAEKLAGLLEEARRLASEASRPRGRGGGRVELPQGVVVEEAFPPCMRDIIERARRGEHLSHHERFAIATFLLNIGAEIDYVVDVFRSMPDFKEKITRYQVEHLAGLRGSGKKYRTYSCEKMKTLGLCRAECGTRSPVQAYYRNLRRLGGARRSGAGGGAEAGATEQESSTG